MAASAQEDARPKLRQRILCRLGCHRWSCEGESGYWVCHGDHTCIHCGHASRPSASVDGDADE